jgi:hypothetical protein
VKQEIRGTVIALSECIGTGNSTEQPISEGMGLSLVSLAEGLWMSYDEWAAKPHA